MSDGRTKNDRAELCVALLGSWARSQRVFNSRTVQDWYQNEVGTKYAELPERALLINIASLGPIRLTDLADAVGRTVSSVSKVVHPLVVNGYVARRIPDYDRRVTLLEATEQGHDLARRVTELDIAVIGQHVEAFDDAELATFVAFLERFADRIAEWERSGLRRQTVDGMRTDTSRNPSKSHNEIEGGIS